MIARVLLRWAIARNGGACPCAPCETRRARAMVVARHGGRLSRQQRRELHRDAWRWLRQ